MVEVCNNHRTSTKQLHSFPLDNNPTQLMKIRLSLLAAALFASQALAGTPVAVPTIQAPASYKHLSGSLTLMGETNYVGRGLVATHAAEQGDGTETIALKTAYSVSETSPWSFENTIAYKILSEGHTLYGSPGFGPNGWATYLGNKFGMTLDPETAEGIMSRPDTIKECNMENEFVFMTAAHYKQDQWNVNFGHRFVHGGILGVMAKHYRDQGASVVNEVFVTPEWTPKQWFSAKCVASYSFQGITGWWFEPSVTFKAPLYRQGEKTVVAALLDVGMSATYGYFHEDYVACANGTQAYWVKLSTPWFITDNIILTPSVSLNWTGNGSDKANRDSQFMFLAQDPNCIPFRDFAVVGGISLTYKF